MSAVSGAEGRGGPPLLHIQDFVRCQVVVALGRNGLTMIEVLRDALVRQSTGRVALLPRRRRRLQVAASGVRVLPMAVGRRK